MNKAKSLALSAVIAAGVALISLAISPLILPSSISPDQMSFEEAQKIATATLQQKCAACHSDHAEVPFYNKLSGGLVEADMIAARRVFNIDEPLNETALAKLQFAIGNGRMPPARYTAVHWGSTLTPIEVVALNKWISTLRATRFSNHLASPSFAGEPVQPIPDSLPTDPAKVKLGKELYHDTRLSSDNTVSCATCHALDKAGTDNLPVSLGVKGADGQPQKGGINAPTTFNAAFHFIQFWDGRAVDLQAQAGGPPLNPVEMGYEHPEDWNKIIDKLKKDKAFTEEFLKAYPDGYSAKNITQAIAEYEKSLITPNSPFDRYLKGDQNAITKEAREGYHYFKKYGCYTCHVGTAMGGQSFEFIGEDFFGHRNETDADKGRFNFTNKEKDKFRLRVPNLRNVEMTWPYMHDASCNTLYEAVDKMFKNLTSVKDATPYEKRRIVDFLRSLTGEYEGSRVKGQPAP